MAQYPGYFPMMVPQPIMVSMPMGPGVPPPPPPGQPMMQMATTPSGIGASSLLGPPPQNSMVHMLAGGPRARAAYVADVNKLGSFPVHDPSLMTLPGTLQGQSLLQHSVAGHNPFPAQAMLPGHSPFQFQSPPMPQPGDSLGYSSQHSMEEVLDEPVIEETSTVLDTYNSDLNLDIDSDGYGAQVLTKPIGFCFTWAGARATFGVTKGRVFYEVHVTEELPVDFGTDHQETNPHVLRVGWSIDSSSFQLGEEPWSFGYGGTGKFSTNNKFSNYGETFGTGDVLGVFVDLVAKPPSIAYSKNGRWLGVATTLNRFPIENKEMAMFPHILSKNMKFKVNFGQMDGWFPPPPGFVYIEHVPSTERVRGQKAPVKKQDCEMIMMIGLPGVGKTTWCINQSKEKTDKRYYIIGTDTLIDKMRVMGLPRRRNFGGRWDTLIQKATQCLNKMFEIGGKQKRNYILDQTNVYASARKRKMKHFQDFICKAAVLVPTDDELVRRSAKRTVEDGKEVPAAAVMEMKANFSLPLENDPLFQQVDYIELPKDKAIPLVDMYNGESKKSKGERGGHYQSERDNKPRDRFSHGPKEEGRPPYPGYRGPPPSTGNQPPPPDLYSKQWDSTVSAPGKGMMSGTYAGQGAGDTGFGGQQAGDKAYGRQQESFGDQRGLGGYGDQPKFGQVSGGFGESNFGSKRGQDYDTPSGREFRDQPGSFQSEPRDLKPKLMEPESPGGSGLDFIKQQYGGEVDAHDPQSTVWTGKEESKWSSGFGDQMYTGYGDQMARDQQPPPPRDSAGPPSGYKTEQQESGQYYGQRAQQPPQPTDPYQQQDTQSDLRQGSNQYYGQRNQPPPPRDVSQEAHARQPSPGEDNYYGERSKPPPPKDSGDHSFGQRERGRFDQNQGYSNPAEPPEPYSSNYMQQPPSKPSQYQHESDTSRRPPEPPSTAQYGDDGSFNRQDRNNRRDTEGQSGAWSTQRGLQGDNYGRPPPTSNYSQPWDSFQNAPPPSIKQEPSSARDFGGMDMNRPPPSLMGSLDNKEQKGKGDSPALTESRPRKRKSKWDVSDDDNKPADEKPPMADLLEMSQAPSDEKMPRTQSLDFDQSQGGQHDRPFQRPGGNWQDQGGRHSNVNPQEKPFPMQGDRPNFPDRNRRNANPSDKIPSLFSKDVTPTDPSLIDESKLTSDGDDFNADAKAPDFSQRKPDNSQGRRGGGNGPPSFGGMPGSSARFGGPRMEGQRPFRPRGPEFDNARPPRGFDGFRGGPPRPPRFHDHQGGPRFGQRGPPPQHWRPN